MVSVIAVADLGGFPGACSVKNRVVASDVRRFAVYSELNGVSAINGMKVHAINACFVSGAALHVSCVFGLGHIAEIAYSVIPWVAIDMVNRVFRERSETIKPCKAMGLPYAAIDTYLYVSPTLCFGAHCLAFFPSWKLRADLIPARVFAASEQTGFRVIMGMIFKLFLSNHFCTLVKAVERMRQPLTRWGSGCIPSRTLSLSTLIVSRQSLRRK